ncbi:unnamed protein product [Linum trigynum]|uniref:Pentatricopeptide repeat-containing protein n=1 Tax=Linum trigynum TaxID=586398 RepID=A0AAV2CXD4_9ROSI
MVGRVSRCQCFQFNAIQQLSMARIIHRNCSLFHRRRKTGMTPTPSSYFASNSTTPTTSNSVTFASVDDALDSFSKMLHMNPRPSVVKFGQLVNSLVRMNAFQAALYASRQMELAGVPHNLYTLSMLLRCFCKFGRVDFGYAVLSRALKFGIQFDDVMLSTLIDGLCKVGRVIEAARLVHKIRILGYHPDAFSYTIIIDGLCKLGQTSAGLELLKNMKEFGCQPNEWS